MKTGIKTAVIVATVFAGTLVVEAQQQRRQQQNDQQSGNRIHQCPNCGWSPQNQQQEQLNPQRQQRRQFSDQGPQRARQQQDRPQWTTQQRQQRRQFSNQGPRQPNRRNFQMQARQQQDRPQWTTQQRQQMMRRRQQILKRFDANKDGQLSTNERKQIRNAWKQRQNEAETKRERPPRQAEQD